MKFITPLALLTFLSADAQRFVNQKQVQQKQVQQGQHEKWQIREKQVFVKPAVPDVKVQQNKINRRPAPVKQVQALPNDRVRGIQKDRPKAPLADSSADTLGLCTGYVGMVAGDPHVATFDRKYYDCQGEGEYIMAKSEGNYEIQARFEKIGTGTVSVTKGLAVAIPSLPTIQLTPAEYSSGAATTISFDTWNGVGTCAYHLYVGGVLTAANVGDVITGEGYVISINADRSVEIQMFEGETPGAAFRITTSGSPSSTMQCFMNAFVCLPNSDTQALETTTGILGTPNSDQDDEWIHSVTGAPITMTSVKQDGYDFCTSHYCVNDVAQSLFVHEDANGGNSFLDLMGCNNQFQTPPDTSNPPAEVIDVCGTENEDCILEGVLGGVDAAEENLEAEDVIIDIHINPEPTIKSLFQVKSIETLVLVEEDICPADITLVKTAGKTLMEKPAIRVVGREDGGFDMKFKKTAALGAAKNVYINYEHKDTRSFVCSAALTEADGEQGIEEIFQKEFSVRCPAGQNHALVEVVVVNPLYDAVEDNAQPSTCCHAEADTLPKVKYVYSVACESSCPTLSRRLRGDF